METTDSNKVRYQYRPRNPADTLLYKTIADHLETFYDMVAADPNHNGLPEYVKEEFESYLACGVLENGFLRYKCGSCAQNLLVGFSCKKRGFCPSCLARRMAEVAAHLTDHVIPKVDCRQWVLSLPFPLRYWCASSKLLTAKVNRIANKAIEEYYIAKANAKGYEKEKLHAGTITFIQRFGGSLNLNVHLHMISPDGVFYDRTEKNLEPKFIKVRAPTDDELTICLQQVTQKVIAMLRSEGYIEPPQDHSTNKDPFLAEEPIHAKAMAASVKQRIAFGERAGQKVELLGKPIHSGFGRIGETAVKVKDRCLTQNGFSLHADVRVRCHQRDRLEKLIRYTARGPLAHDHLEQDDNGDLIFHFRKPWSDGTSAVKFKPLEMIEKMVALIPLPRFHMFRYSGVFAPNSRMRSKIIPQPEKPENVADEEDELPDNLRYMEHIAKKSFWN
jgi:hypothetical protein